MKPPSGPAARQDARIALLRKIDTLTKRRRSDDAVLDWFLQNSASDVIISGNRLAARSQRP